MFPNAPRARTTLPRLLGLTVAIACAPTYGVPGTDPAPDAPASPPASATSSPTRAVSPRVAVHIGAHTLLVVHVDLERLDVAPWFEYVAAPVEAALAQHGEAAREFRAGIDGARGMAVALASSLHEAGITDLVVTMSVDQLGTPLVAATGAAFDQQRTIDALAPLGFEDARVLDGAMVFGPRAALDARTNAEPAHRPDLMAALDAGAGSAVRVAIAPPDYLRRALLETTPELPESMGGAAPGPALTATRWAALATRPDGAPGLMLTLDCGSPDGAAASRSFLETTLRALLADSMSDAAQAAALLTPDRRGDRLELVVDEQRIRLVAEQALPWFMTARASAMRTQSMQHVRMLLMGCHMYASEHDNAWPPSLDALVRAGHVQAEQLRNPRFEGLTYAYVRPAGDVARGFDAQRVLVHEILPDDGSIETVVVGFADGHVEVRPRAELPALAEAARLGAARDPKEVDASMRRVKRIVIACHTHASDLDGTPPESLAVLVTVGLLEPEALVTPFPAPGSTYGYRVPAKRMADADPGAAMVWEQLEAWRPAGAVVGFASGIIELVTDEERYRALTRR